MPTAEARTRGRRVALGLLAAILGITAASAQSESTQPGDLATGQQAFYDGRYAEASGYALARRLSAPDDLAGYELRTSAILFQLKRLLGDDQGERIDIKKCDICAGLLAAFLSDVETGRTHARARVAADPDDEVALFFLAKLNLNHLWLHLGPLGRRTGWNEYWEARRTLDHLLELAPTHVRGRVARGWIDYIVDTRMPFGTKWLLGGGNRTGAVAAIRSAAADDASFFASAEARFALWELLVREHDLEGAVLVARDLSRDFPSNSELERFVGEHSPNTAAPAR